jgi:hypothetical protein
MCKVYCVAKKRNEISFLDRKRKYNIFSHHKFFSDELL